MNSVSSKQSLISFSRLAYGCWRIAGSPSGREAVLTAYDLGFRTFDLADIYSDGEAERLFGRILKEHPGLRQQLTVVSKCGVRKAGEPKPNSPYRYDFSAGHIVGSCEGSLARLGIETLDLYLLHRPDYLMDPAEVAAAFTQLRDAGKVRQFGVSNFRPSQVQALQRACPMPLLVNQVEISLANLQCLEDGTLDHCLAEEIVPMAWSPLAGGKLGDGPRHILPAQEAYQTTEVLAEIDQIALDRQVSRTAVALAWLLKHPARIVPVVGSVAPQNIRAAASAVSLELSREEWYRLFRAARGQRLP